MEDRYTIDSPPVGQGGFGKVRKGHDRVLDRTVAVKQLDQLLADADETEKLRFHREARILAKLSHPNIPCVYDVKLAEDKLEIYFQFVDGKNVRRVLEEDGALSLAECRVWFDQVASALEHAHSRGVIHRDIKPENLIVSADGKHCYLVDFGISLCKDDAERLTGSDEWIGTPGYMSPEQERGEKPVTSDDIYSLGITFYEVLCGHSITKGGYTALSAANELIPPAIDELVQRCIADNPRRVQTAAEFRKGLGSALQDHRTLSEVLGSGQLREVVSAIAEMTPDQFMALKKGQRLLVLQKCKDVVIDDDPKLQAARVEMLQVLTKIGIHLDPKDFENIVVPAVRHGIGNEDRNGVRVIRDSICFAGSKVTTANHTVITSALLDWLTGLDLEQQKPRLYHEVRPILNALLANPECDEETAPKIADMLDKINELHRSKAHEIPEERLRAIG